MVNNLHIAQSLAWSLATTLMVCITLFSVDQEFGIVPSSEFDGDPDTVIRDYDHFEIMDSSD